MLTASFVMTAAFELAIVFLTYESNQILLSIGFSLLLFESSASIYFEDNPFIKNFRELFKEQGIDSEKVDVLINGFRVIAYIFAVSQFINYSTAFWIVITILSLVTIFLGSRIEF